MQSNRSRKKTYSANYKKWLKVRGNCWDEIRFALLRNWLLRQISVKLHCVEFSKKTSKPLLTRYKSGINLHAWDLIDHGTFWISWSRAFCQIWSSVIKIYLIFNSMLIAKMTEFGAKMTRKTQESQSTSKSSFYYDLGCNNSRWTISFCFCPHLEWKSTVTVTFLIFWKLSSFHGHIDGAFSKTLIPLMAQKVFKAWSWLKTNDRQGALIWTILTFLSRLY